MLHTTGTYNQPLISVIIPCYNHGRYLSKAISSIREQKDYSNYEIIVVDDGSIDDTRSIAENFAGVVYVYQENAGLSAARNTGIENSKGDYLIFLDADDWLFPDAMATNIRYILGNDKIAFVSGGYEYWYEDKNQSEFLSIEVREKHYCKFLEMNYIGMHAAVLYQRWVFNDFLYDTSLKACEDYDMYLRITRKYPVVHHTQLIAVYRVHTRNMSGNILLMLDSAKKVLGRQEKYLENDEERACYEKGHKDWEAYYTEQIYTNLAGQSLARMNKPELAVLKQYNRKLYRALIKRKRREDAVKVLKLFIPKTLLNTITNKPK